MPLVFISSMICSKSRKTSGLRIAPLYTSNASADARTASYNTSNRPAGVSCTSASPPASENTRFAMRRNVSTSAKRAPRLFVACASRRSYSCDASSGTIKICRFPLVSRAAMRRRISVVFPVPARPIISFMPFSSQRIYPELLVYQQKAKKDSRFLDCLKKFGADDEARTRYLHLGKVALYQMSYIRILLVPPGGIEPPTRGFSVPCSTD